LLKRKSLFAYPALRTGGIYCHLTNYNEQNTILKTIEEKGVMLDINTVLIEKTFIDHLSYQG
jgi:hypothetical protein